MRLAAVLALALLLAGCQADDETPMVVGTTSASPYAGSLTVPVGDSNARSVLERSGAAGRALQCDGPPYDGNRADYDSEPVFDDAAQALERFLSQVGFGGMLPARGWLVEREADHRVLFSYDVAHRTRAAVVVQDDAVHDLEGRGWRVQVWAECDPVEWPAAVADDRHLGLWQDRSGARVPLARVESSRGAEHCDWQDVTFLRVGPREGTETYVGDPAEGFDPHLRTTFAARVGLPRDAVDTGWHRDGRELWLSPRKEAAYLVDLRDALSVERWPAVKEPILCA